MLWLLRYYEVWYKILIRNLGRLRCLIMEWLLQYSKLLLLLRVKEQLMLLVHFCVFICIIKTSVRPLPTCSFYLTVLYHNLLVCLFLIFRIGGMMVSSIAVLVRIIMERSAGISLEHVTRNQRMLVRGRRYMWKIMLVTFLSCWRWQSWSLSLSSAFRLILLLPHAWWSLSRVRYGSLLLQNM